MARSTLSGDWQPDLFGGRGIIRLEARTRAEDLAMARREMMATNSPDLFDALRQRPTVDTEAQA